MLRSFQFLLAASGVWATTLPLYFEPNQGQAHPRVEFLSRRSPKESIAFRGFRAISGARIEASGTREFRSSERCSIAASIPGIDLVYYGTAANIEYYFQIAPGADPGKIHIAYEGTGGLKLDRNGDLILSTKTGEMRQKSPLVYQIVDGHRKEIAAAYKMQGRKTVGLTVADSTFFGGPGVDGGDAVKVDAAGNVYIAAGLAVPLSDSNPFSSSPTNTAGPIKGAVIKFSPAQNAILFVAHVGSDAITYVRDLAIDSAGNMYLAGSTVSLDFPLVNPIVSKNLSGSFSPFISKISADGKSLVYSTYFGGHAWDTGEGVAVDSDGNAYFTGVKESADFPILNAIYSSGDETGAFLAKISPAGSLLFSTLYLGMPGANRVVVDSSGVYMVGLAAAAVFPVKNSIQQNQPGQVGLVGAVKFSLDGQSVIYATMFGGSGGEATAAAVDSQGNLYMAGFASPDFPVVNAVQNTPGLGNDGFVAEINPQGNALAFSTYLAGNADDLVDYMALDAAGNIYVGGSTTSTDFPVLNAPVTSIPKVPGQRNPYYGYLTAYSPSGQSMIYSTLIGGSVAGEEVWGIATDAAGNVYIVGETASPDFPVTANAYQPSFGGQWDTYLMVLGPVSASLPPSVTILPQSLIFTASGGPTPPPAQIVNVTAAADAVITASVSTTSGGNWLSATLTGAAQISVTANPAGLTIGNYYGTVSVKGGGGVPASVNVILSVPAPGPVLTSYSLTAASTTFPGFQPPLTIYGSGFLPGASAKVYLNGALGAGQPTSIFIEPPSITVVDSNTVQFYTGVGSSTPITIAVTVTNIGSLESNALPILLGAPSPQIVGVQNAAAAGQPNAVQPISPGEMITITGTDFGSPVGISAPANSGTPLTQLGSTRVLFNGIPVPVTYVSFAQINVVAPFSISGGVMQVVPSMTGLFTANSTGSGQGAFLNQDSTSNSASNGAALGSVVTMYATGMGTTNPALPDGTAPQNSSVKPVLAVSATIDGQPAEVVSAFAAPGMLGILQVSVQVPASAHTGAAIPVMLQVGNSQSQPGVTMATQ